VKGLNFLAGVPKSGKTMISIIIATNAAECDYPVLYIDCENGRPRIILRILSRMLRVPVRSMLLNYETIINAKNFEAGKERFMNLMPRFFIHRISLRDLPLKNERDGKDNIELMKDLFRKYISSIRDEWGLVKELLIVVDQLQKLPTWGLSDRRAGIDSWLRAFEQIRDELNVTFLVISELSRSGYESVGLNGFKESGDIEYASDAAFLLKKEKDERGEEILELHCVANRDGETGLVATYKPNFEFCDFEELTNNIYREEIRRGR
jgi:replicative DNA helicase